MMKKKTHKETLTVHKCTLSSHGLQNEIFSFSSICWSLFTESSDVCLHYAWHADGMWCVYFSLSASAGDRHRVETKQHRAFAERAFVIPSDLESNFRKCILENVIEFDANGIGTKCK